MDIEIAMKKIVTWGKNGYVTSDQKEKIKINKTVQTLWDPLL